MQLRLAKIEYKRFFDWKWLKMQWSPTQRQAIYKEK